MTTADCAYGINTPTKTVIVGDGINEIDRKQMKGRAGRKGLGFKAFFISMWKNLDFPINISSNLEGIEDSSTELRHQIYHYEPLIYEKFKNGNWINKNIHHILYLKEDYYIDKEFYKKSYLLFGLGAILAPSILKELIKKTKSGESNRNIRIILGLIGCIPQNKPYQIKEEWGYEIPEKVLEIYKNNGFNNYNPNWFAYQCLMNQKNEFSFSQKEEFILNGKYWSYLFFLLLPIFRKIMGENKGEELYSDIQELITNSIINM
jgi:hypothetical protein